LFYDNISAPQCAKTYEILSSDSGIGEDSSLLEYDTASQDAASDKTNTIISRVFYRINGLKFLWCYEAG